MRRLDTQKSPVRIGLVALCVLATVLSACKGDGGSGTGGDQPADPVQQDIAIAYIVRGLPTEMTNESETPTLVEEDLLDPIAFRPGARLVVRARATPGAQEQIISDRIFGAEAQYDVKDLEVSYDGSKLLFAARAPEIEDAEPEDQPTWDIWEYNLNTDTLRRIIESDVAEAQGQDINPHYLPDGRIVFSSTRQILAKANMLDEGKPQYNPQGESRDRDMCALHVMNSDGSNITQITFNSSHEIEPVVNNNGEIVYLRWDNIGSHNEIDLYKLRPDGTEHQHLYGRNSHNSGTDGAAIEYRRLQAAPDGRLLALMGPREQSVYGGQLIYLDPENFSDNEQPVPNSTSSAATAQTDATHFPIRSDDEISLGGYISAAFPLWDNTDRMVISWSECLVQLTTQTLPCTAERVAMEGAVVLPPAYGLWMYQAEEETLRPLILPAADRLYTDVVVMQERTAPPQLAAKNADDATFDSSLVDDKLGILHIRSVYDLDGVFFAGNSGPTSLEQMRLLPPAQRPARFLRLEKAVLMPDEDTREVENIHLDRAREQLMRDIIGYAPIEPDGSVKVKVTANVPFTLSILDKDGQSISPRHQYWLQLAPGEILTCNGCHEADSTTPHGRPDARPDALNTGASAAGPYAGLNPEYSALAGETMAETHVRVDAARTSTPVDASLPSADIKFTDIWSLSPAASFNWRYSDLDDDDDPDNDSIEAPTNASCEPVWTALCRVTIHYPTHIAPLWDHPRNTIRDRDGNPIEDENGDMIDQCTDCHSRTSARFGDPLFGTDAEEERTQLDLTNEPATTPAAHLISYRYLFFSQTAQERNAGGTLVDKPQRDENDNEICTKNPDGTDNVNPVTGICNLFETVSVPPTMTGNPPSNRLGSGARASSNFFAPFEDDGSHAGWLTPAELKMISEWLDIGAQYYNDPFVIPQG